MSRLTKSCCVLLGCSLLSAVCSLSSADPIATPIKWTVERSRPAPFALPIKRGESVDIMPRFYDYSVGVDLSGAQTIDLFYRAAGNTNLYFVPGSTTSNRGEMIFHWTPAAELTNSQYSYEIMMSGLTNTSIRQEGTITMLPNLGYTAPATNPTPIYLIDFAVTRILNSALSPFSPTNVTVGPQGPQGPQGVPGTNGTDGAVGPQGLPGTNGVDGAQGPQGPQGIQGPPGTNGANGAQGPQGIQGPPGTNGADGAVGPQGPQGPTGSVSSLVFTNSDIGASTLLDGVLKIGTNITGAAIVAAGGITNASQTPWAISQQAGFDLTPQVSGTNVTIYASNGPSCFLNYTTNMTYQIGADFSTNSGCIFTVSILPNTFSSTFPTASWSNTVSITTGTTWQAIIFHRPYRAPLFIGR
jgi:hypothetical protein